jgi:hypothetical protein
VLLKKRDKAAEIQAGWAEQYGLVYERPEAFGSTAVVLMDPKAIAHFHAESEVPPILTNANAVILTWISDHLSASSRQSPFPVVTGNLNCYKQTCQILIGAVDGGRHPHCYGS